MEDKDFSEAMRRMVKDNGKDVLLGDKTKAFISDYKGQFVTEANIFNKLLEAGCARFINEADDILQRKRQLVKKMEDEEFIARKFSMEMLDLLGFLLKGDTSKCMEQPGDDLYDKGEAAFARKDLVEAAGWYQKAAEQGHVKAQTDLAWCYRHGQGVPRDKAKVIEWYLKAAEQGYAEAQYGMGNCYVSGIGVPVDDFKAAEWYGKAADQGLAKAQSILGTFYYMGGYQGKGFPQDYAKAFELYKKAADQGYFNAQQMLGTMYNEGKGVPKDYAKAVEWYRKAAEQGTDTGVLVQLGKCYENGLGDCAKAAEWYGKAADKGSVPARKELDRLKASGKI